MTYLDKLNKEQKQAVTTDAKHVRVVAGAGSGKTRVLTSRIAYLVNELNYNPHRILAITFTNKAANEMKKRVEELLASDIGVFVSTIHSLCVRIIREEYEALNLVRNFTILDAYDQRSVLKEAYEEYGYKRRDLSFNIALDYISNHKMRNVSIKQAYKLAEGNEYELQKARIYDYYVNRLNQVFALDFDDLLLKVDQLFKTNDQVLRKWQYRFNVILVDEFQDVDNIQYSIIDSLVSDQNELYVVGDPDQTIYTWRGANVKNILDFDDIYPKSKTITLHQNYRSTQNILDSANRLIKFNPDRLEKDLEAFKGRGEAIKYENRVDERDEAFYLVNTIQELQNSGVPLLEMAILYRSNYLSNNIEKYLVNYKIPYVIYGGLRFYDRQEIKDIMSYMRMVSHGDDFSLRRSVSIPRQGIGEKTLNTLFEEGQLKDKTIFEVMQEKVKNNEGGSRIKEYVEKIESYKKYYEKNESIYDLMVHIFDDSGLRKHYDKDQELERIENVKVLMGEALEFQNNQVESGLEDYVQMISLYGDRDEVLSGDYIRLMTIHAAKGLEFENVFLIGMNDGVFPNQNSLREGREGLIEERRLAYVAMTRAKDRLFVTSNQGYNFVTETGNRPSRFIKEMGLGEKPKELKKEVYRRSRENVLYRPGDLVMHDTYGEGIVISLDKDIISIAFDSPIGIKKIRKDFAGLRLKGDLA